MKDKQTILQLYDVFMDKIYGEVAQTKEEISHYIELEDKLQDSLNDEQKQILEEIRELDNKKQEKVNKHTFISAFSLATRLFAEGLK